MCGICGTYNLIDENLLGRMCRAIAHRGPDDEGHYVDSDVMLGMRRLKIIDLETGNQPIYNEDRNIVIVFNGEIYNYKENRKYLEEKGHRFYTNSDTETIVHLYEEFGTGCVERLRGMFAFALWDAENKKLILARDRVGIKPLYYYFKNDVLIFASELKAILQCPDVQREINFSAVHDYLTYMCVPAPDTIFQDIYKLEPAHMLVCVNGQVDKKKYWDACSASEKNADGSHKENDIKEQLYGLIYESIKMHLVSDVPLGVFLSGGMDSGSIVAIMSEVADVPIKTFSIGFDDEYYSELENARMVAERFGTEHHEYVLTRSSTDGIEDIVGCFDEPFADSSAIPTYYVSKHARERVTVALSGDGGDEVFGGYGNYKADKIGMIYRRFHPYLKERVIPSAINCLPDTRDYRAKTNKIKKILTMAAMSAEHGHIFWLSCFSDEAKSELYAHKMLGQLLSINSFDKYGEVFKTCRSQDFLNRCICVDLKTVLPNDYLTKVDMMSMANSLEVRVPFLDHKLVEFAVSLDSKYKLRGLTTKYLLKKIMQVKLPNSIIQGRKKGFSIPLTKWFREDFSVLVNEFLSEDIIKKRGYFNYKFVKRLSDDHLSGGKDNSKLLWTLISFEIWHRRFMG